MLTFFNIKKYFFLSIFLSPVKFLRNFIIFSIINKKIYQSLFYFNICVIIMYVFEREYGWRGWKIFYLKRKRLREVVIVATLCYLTDIYHIHSSFSIYTWSLLKLHPFSLSLSLFSFNTTTIYFHRQRKGNWVREDDFKGSSFTLTSLSLFYSLSFVKKRETWTCYWS